MVKIDDFIDFNYERVTFDVRDVDKTELKKRLDEDYVNHLWELEDANFIAIWNCDCHGFERECDVFFDSDENVYNLYKLIHTEDGWFYEDIGPRIVRYELQQR